MPGFHWKTGNFSQRASNWVWH